VAGDNQAAIERARARRVRAEEQAQVRVEWFIREVCDRVAFTMRERLMIACEMLRSKIVRNISRAVVKVRGRRSGRIRVTERSRPGEFPRADTTTLMKSVFWWIKEEEGGSDGCVGVPLDYGAILETSESLDRKYLTRTLSEEQVTVARILGGPIRQ